MKCWLPGPYIDVNMQMSGLKILAIAVWQETIIGIDIARASRMPLPRDGYFIHFGEVMATWSCKQENYFFAFQCNT